MKQMVESILTDGQEPNKDVLKRLRDAAKYPITYDEEAPELSDQQLAEFHRVKSSLYANPELFKPRKQQITLKLDADVIAAFKATGKGYQTRINALLRECAEAHGLLVKQA